MQLHVPDSSWHEPSNPMMRMRKLVLAAVLALPLLTLAACKRPASAKLEGRWKGLKATGVPDTAQVSANSFATSSEIIAQGNQITFNTPGGRQPAATFTVEKEDPTSVIIHTDRDGSAETFTFNDKADEMVWKIDAQRTITFKKQPAP